MPRRYQHRASRSPRTMVRSSNTTQPAQAAGVSSFLRLPPEMREEIYKLVLPSQVYFDLSPSINTRRHDQSLSLFKTSRLIREESRACSFRNARFVFHITNESDEAAFLCWVEKQGDKQMERLAHLELEVPIESERWLGAFVFDEHFVRYKTSTLAIEKKTKPWRGYLLDQTEESIYKQSFIMLERDMMRVDDGVSLTDHVNQRLSQIQANNQGQPMNVQKWGMVLSAISHYTAKMQPESSHFCWEHRIAKNIYNLPPRPASGAKAYVVSGVEDYDTLVSKANQNSETEKAARKTAANGGIGGNGDNG